MKVSNKIFWLFTSRQFIYGLMFLAARLKCYSDQNSVNLENHSKIYKNSHYYLNNNTVKKNRRKKNYKDVFLKILAVSLGPRVQNVNSVMCDGSDVSDSRWNIDHKESGHIYRVFLPECS